MMKNKLTNFITSPVQSFHERTFTPPVAYGPILASVLAIAVLALGVAMVAAQGPVPSLPDTPYNYANITLPPHFTAAAIANLDNTPPNNPITDDGATLGRVLFYDSNLSANNTVSCASCHQQTNGFSDPNQLSLGFEGGFTGRNSMGLSNARYYPSGHFFWDERADSLEEQVLMPIQDAVEMGMNLDDLVEKLAAESYYPPLFENAFGSSEITSERIAQALAQFVRAMVSYQTKYDQGVATNFQNFTPQENQGRRLFNGRGRCDVCHTTDAFVANQARNIGLDAVTVDSGLSSVTGNPNDAGKFKVPSLRNVALTAPYMHDGRFNSLVEVIEHYNSQIENHANLDPILRQNGQPRRLNLTQAGKDALLAFLQTFTDQALVTDTRFSNPFVTAINFTNQIYLPIVIR